MEVFFLFFQKIFPGPSGPAGWGGEQDEKSSDLVGQPQQRGQYQPAQGEEIRPAPQQQRGHVIDAHLPVVPQEGEGEQAGRAPQPEQQVQHEGQGAQPQAPAQGAHPVVNEAQQRPQQEALTENGGLAYDVYVHGQRSSREKKPIRPAPSSS